MTSHIPPRPGPASALVAVTALLTLLALLPAAAAWSATTLRYGGPVGQVAEYRLTAAATGEQVSLGERRPIRAEMEWEIREEVVGAEPDGTLLVEVTGRLAKLKDTASTLGTRPGPLPTVRLRVSPTGEVAAAKPNGVEGPADSPEPKAEGTGHPAGAEASPATGAQGRALASLLARPLPVVLPCEAVEPNAPWRWEKDGARQTNTLVGMSDGVARVTSQGAAPLALEERSEALGLTAKVSGSETETSSLELLLDPGVVLRHQGTATVEARSEVELMLAEGTRRFPLQVSARLDFDLRLLRLNGANVRAPATSTAR